MTKARKSSLVSCATLGLILCTGCADLKVTRLPVSEATFPDATLPYILPKRTFVITTTYVLTNCDGDPDIDVSATVTAKTVPDANHRYFIPYPESGSRLKSADYKVTSYDSQTFRGFNGTVKDATGEIVVAVISAVTKIAGAFIGVTEDLAKKDLLKKNPPCKPEASQSLKELKRFSARKEYVEYKVANEEKPYSPITDAEIAAKAQALSSLTAIQETTWTPTPGDLAIKLELLETTICGWFDCGSASVNKYLLIGADLENPRHIPRTTLVAQIDVDPRKLVDVDLDPQYEPEKSTYCDPKLAGAGRKCWLTFNGLVVRHPVPATLSICKNQCPPLDSAGNAPRVVAVNDRVHQSHELIPQFGKLVLLPLHNGVGQDSALNLEMAENGGITSVGIISTSTIASSIANLGGAAEGVGALSESRAKAKADVQSASKSGIKDANELLAACLEAQATILKNKGIPIGNCQ